jgi:hypothetical protein
MMNGINNDQDGFFLLQRLPDHIPQLLGIPLNHFSIFLPLKWGVREKDSTLVWKDPAGGRAVFAQAGGDRAAAETVTQFITQFFEQSAIDRVREVGNENLNANLLG